MGLGRGSGGLGSEVSVVTLLAESAAQPGSRDDFPSCMVLTEQAHKHCRLGALDVGMGMMSHSPGQLHPGAVVHQGSVLGLCP